MNIVVTGFFGTGSSAVIDLLKEYDNISIVPETGFAYEHSVFFAPGGLFDLCVRLLYGNSPQSSDMAINDFITAMKRLNDNDFGWFGSYKSLFGDDFMRIVHDFVKKISTTKKGSNSNHYKAVRYSLIKAAAQYLLHITRSQQFNGYGRWYVEDGKPVYLSMPSEDEFFIAARDFTSAYMNLFKTCNYKVFDHLLWPQQINTFMRCFYNDIKIIVVDRDPRDVFISDQNIWSTFHFSSNLDEFIDEWKRTMDGCAASSNAMRVHFEDLIYNYDETVKMIEDFIGISSSSHCYPHKYLDPQKSIENTQVYLLKDEWMAQAKILKKELYKYLYTFKEHRVPNRKLIFK